MLPLPEKFRAPRDTPTQPVTLAGCPGELSRSWIPLLYGDAEVGKVALAPGELSAPEYAQEGIYIVEKLSGPESRELDDRIGLKLTLELTQKWQDEALQEGTANGTVKMNFNSRLYDWVADQVFVTAPRVPVTGPAGR